MAPALKSLFDPAALRRAKARFDAWWEGAPAPSQEDALFDTADSPPAPAPRDPRFGALALLWGEGRIAPGLGALERQRIDAVQAPPESTLALLGPQGMAAVETAAGAHPGPIHVLEWRTEALHPLIAAVAAVGLSGRVKVTGFELEAPRLAQGVFGGLVSDEAFTYCGAAGRLAAQLARALKPGARAGIGWYASLEDADYAGAFAAAFAEPRLRALAFIPAALTQAGLDIDAEADDTPALLAVVRERLAAFAQAAGDAPPDPRTLQEIAWETQSWAERRRLMSAGRLRRLWALAQRTD